MIEKNKDLTINEAEYVLPDEKKGTIAVFMYTGGSDPKKILDGAVRTYVKDKSYHELIDAHLDNPWMRVVLSDDINGMKQKVFDPQKDSLGKIET